MELLKRKDFRRLMVGKATSLMGSNMQQFALSLYVLSITGSATIFASILALSILPRLLLSPVAGVFGDWFDRKKTIVRLDLLNGCLIGLYALYYYLNGELSLLSIYVLVIVLEVTEIFFGSAMGAVIPSMIEKEKLFEANSIKSVIMNFGNIAAPLVASSLYGFFGIQIILIVNAVSFIISAISEMTIHIPSYNKTPEKVNLKAFKKDFTEGVKLLGKHKILLNIIGLGVFLNFSLSPLFSVGLVFILFDVLKVTAFQYGLITALMSASMLLGPVLLGKKAQTIPATKLVIMTFLSLSVVILSLAFFVSPYFTQLFSSHLIPMVMVTMVVFIVGLLASLSNIALGTLFETLVPNEYMGRVGSLMNLGLMASMPVGQILFGLSVDWFSPTLSIVIVGAIVFAATLYFRKPFLNSEEAVCSSNISQMKAES